MNMVTPFVNMMGETGKLKKQLFYTFRIIWSGSNFSSILQITRHHSWDVVRFSEAATEAFEATAGRYRSGPVEISRSFCSDGSLRLWKMMGKYGKQRDIRWMEEILHQLVTIGNYKTL